MIAAEVGTFLEPDHAAVAATPAVLVMRARRILRSAPIGAIFLAAAVVSGCGSSTTTVTAPSTIARCGVTLSATDATVPADGGTGRITVTTARECAWSAAAEVGWLSISGPNSGQGDGSIEYRVAANGDPVARRGGIALNDKRAEVTQAAGTCVIQLRQPSASFPQVGGTGAIDVVASSQMCTWTAVQDVEWITITSGSNGKGTASVAFAVAPTTGPPRTATIAIADQRFSIVQSEGCSYTISPESFTTGASGGDGTITVSTAPGCPWTTLSNAPWIGVAQGATGTGPGLVRFSVAPTSGPARAGGLTVAGRAFPVTQSSGCSYHVAPSTHSAPAAGGDVTITLNAASGCLWSAASNSPWITVVGASSGNGAGAVTLRIAATTGPGRSGSATIAEQTVNVTQTQGCSFAISPESQGFGSSGGTGSVSITTESGCGWSAASQAEWIRITSATNGSGSSTVQYSVAATTGAGRSGTMLIAGRTFTVTQSESCGLTLVPDNVRVNPPGGTTSFNVQTGGSCAWTAVPQVPWITITGSDRATGNGTVQLAITPNMGERRTGTVIVSDGAGVAPATFTVVQDNGCDVTLSSPGMTIGSAGGPGTVDVMSDATCEWNVRTEDSWISITSGPRGSGNGTVTFNVVANLGAPRTGVIRIGGRSFTINQQSGCTFAIDPTSQVMPAAGGETNVTVTADASCTWTAGHDVPWIAVVSGTTGSGSGPVRLAIAASTDAARTGTATIAGLKFTVNQESGCTYGVSPAAIPVAAGGGPASFNVTTSGPGCTWTATTTEPSWITITSGSGTGGGAVNFTVQANPGAARTGTINVQGQIVTISQAGM